MFCSAVADHVRYAIANAEVRQGPFPHFFVRDVFPADFYQEILANLPADDGYESSAYGSRSMCLQTRLEKGFWAVPTAWLLIDLAQFVRFKFAREMNARFSKPPHLMPNIRLVRDTDGYAIKPHTDHPGKVVSLLFYLPPDDSLKECGTALYRPKDPGFRCEGRSRWPFASFDEVWRAPFLPNTCLGFFKTDQTFHGVPKIDQPGIVRNMLLVNIYDMAFANEMKVVS